MESIKHFFYMGGYAFYVWGAYGSVLTFLAIQWYLLREPTHEQHS